MLSPRSKTQTQLLIAFFTCFLALLVVPALVYAQAPGGSSGSALNELGDRQILVMFEEDVLSLPPRAVKASPEEAIMPANVRAAVSSLNAEDINAGYPGFERADTLRILSDGRIYRAPDYTNLFVITLPSQVDRDEAVALFEALPQVRYAEKNQRVFVRAATTTSDFSTGSLSTTAYPSQSGAAPVFPSGQSRFTEQWGLYNPNGPDIRAPYAWGITRGSPSIKIGVIDTGVEAAHRDLSGKVSGVLTDRDVLYSHGTHVAGIAAARGDNPGGGTVGVDWYAKIHSEQTGDSDTHSDWLTQTAQAIDRTVNANVRVMNNSWGYAYSSLTLSNALVAAQRADILLVHANPYNKGGIHHESNYPNNIGPWILNVGAIGSDGLPHGNTGSRWFTDVGAPGGNILSTVRGNNHGSLSGTSMAAPFVSGTASLMLSVNPTLRNYDLEQILKRTARRTDGGTGWDSRVGYGMIDAYEAVRAVVAPNTVVHGAASFVQTNSNVTQTFTNAPATGIAAGSYFVDIYRLQATPSFYYDDLPWAWLGTGPGFSGANPNDAQPWLYQSVSQSSAVLRTFFYYIRSNMTGQTVNRWVPFDPYDSYNHQSGRFEYTVLGKPGTPPLTVSITNSPGFLREGDFGSWTATATGGPSGDHTFRWYARPEGVIHPTLVREHTTSSSTDTYGTIVSESFRLSVRVDRGGQSAESPWQFVFVEPEDCDPQVEICSAPPGNFVAESMQPDAYLLGSNYPNPFNSTTEIQYALPEAARVSIIVVDLLGREVARPVDGRQERGYHTAMIDGTAWSSGVYIYRMEATGESGETFTDTRRLTLLK